MEIGIPPYLGDLTCTYQAGVIATGIGHLCIVTDVTIVPILVLIAHQNHFSDETILTDTPIEWPGSILNPHVKPAILTLLVICEQSQASE